MGDSGGSPDSRIWKKWSITHKLSRAASSAAVAILETTGPICSAGQGNVVMPMPSLMNASLVPSCPLRFPLRFPCAEIR